jgi:C-terminal processing protease CtpA/Prc
MIGLRKLSLLAFMLVFAALACSLPNLGSPLEEGAGEPTLEPSATPLIAAPIAPDGSEPVLVSGTIPFTSPFFLNGIAEPFVLLEDEAGFVKRDRDFEFNPRGQTIGPVELINDNTLAFELTLPSVPQGTLVDVDNNGQSDTGIQVFAVAYWSNTWGDTFLESRDGTGWSTAYTSAIVDSEQDDEIVGGVLLVWSPDDAQSFPVGFGDDGLLFTEDDPVESIPAGYNIVNLDQDPFQIYKQSHLELVLFEGVGAVKDFSNMRYGQAFDALFERVSVEYPFTAEKHIDWDALYAEFAPRAADARSDDDFYRVILNFTQAFPDGHVGGAFNANIFREECGGSFGLVLAELSDRRVIATHVLPGTPGAQAGIQVGAEIITWDGQPVGQAVDAVQPYFGAGSTEYTRRAEQLVYLTHVPPGTTISVEYQNPGSSTAQTADMRAVIETESLLLTIPSLQRDELALPLEGEVLDGSGLGYIEIATFSDDYNLMAQLWERFIDSLIEDQVPGLIIDLRANGGGSTGLAADFAGYFFDEEIELFQRSYYNELTGAFEYADRPSRVEPGPLYYGGPIALLVSTNCVSACEGFSYTLTQRENVIVVGHTPTAGAFGEVGQGQYKLPGEIELQFPTGRPETLDGQLLLEGVGVVPDIIVPVTEDSALGRVDAVLEAAIEALR